MMEGLFVVFIVFLAPLLALLILGGLVLAGIKMWRGGPSRQRRAEEERLIQEIYQGFSKMEQRVEALETILLDPERKGRDGTQL